MLRDGAAVAETAGDVLRQLGEPSPVGPHDLQGSLFEIRSRGPESEARGPADRLREALLAGPAQVDDLARGAGLGTGAALATLCRMELVGVVRALPGHRFELVRRG